jgi:hypothetical protein
MAITTLDGLIASAKQQLVLKKTTALVTAALPVNSGTMWHLAGDPGAGVLAVGNTTAGVVPTAATAGSPRINAFGASANGYLLGLEASNSVAATLVLYDRLWHAGAFSFATNYALTGVPSFSTRVPGGTDFTNTEIWIEQVTAGTLVQNVAITYTNQAGGTGKLTGTVAAPAAMIVGRMFPMPLAAGDSGVQAITNVTGSVASAGTYNVVIMRRLATVRIPLANGAVKLGFAETALVELFAASCLALMVQPDSTSTGLPCIGLTIGNG